nr:hypothetical protein [Salinirubrum litoreum]
MLGLGLIVVLLLALGAVPSYLGSGDPYYLTVQPVATADTSDASPNETQAVNMTGYSERRYPYLTSALASDDGRSEGYQEGALGLKEAFSHSPFDEFDALVAQNPDARSDGSILVVVDGDYYRVQVTQAG